MESRKRDNRITYTKEQEESLRSYRMGRRDNNKKTERKAEIDRGIFMPTSIYDIDGYFMLKYCKSKGDSAWFSKEVERAQYKPKGKSYSRTKIATVRTAFIDKYKGTDKNIEVFSPENRKHKPKELSLIEQAKNYAEEELKQKNKNNSADK